MVRCHHLLKTFWGWRDKQVRAVIRASPSGDTYVTTPGSALLFPALCKPTGALPAPAAPAPEVCGDRTGDDAKASPYDRLLLTHTSVSTRKVYLPMARGILCHSN